MSDTKISIRFFDDREVRALWEDENAKWWFSVLDIVAVLTDQNDYTKTRNYWKYLKAKLKKEGSQLVSATTQLKLTAADDKNYKSDMLDYQGIIALGKTFPGTKANRFIDCFNRSAKSPPLRMRLSVCDWHKIKPKIKSVRNRKSLPQSRFR